MPVAVADTSSVTSGARSHAHSATGGHRLPRSAPPSACVRRPVRTECAALRSVWSCACSRRAGPAGGRRVRQPLEHTRRAVEVESCAAHVRRATRPRRSRAHRARWRRGSRNQQDAEWDASGNRGARGRQAAALTCFVARSHDGARACGPGSCDRSRGEPDHGAGFNYCEGSVAGGAGRVGRRACARGVLARGEGAAAQREGAATR